MLDEMTNLLHLQVQWSQLYNSNPKQPRLVEAPKKITKALDIANYVYWWFAFRYRQTKVHFSTITLYSHGN
jgi:hypothetical protein